VELEIELGKLHAIHQETQNYIFRGTIPNSLNELSAARGEIDLVAINLCA
jgi:hypothetical protein